MTNVNFSDIVMNFSQSNFTITPQKEIIITRHLIEWPEIILIVFLYSFISYLYAKKDKELKLNPENKELKTEVFYLKQAVKWLPFIIVLWILITAWTTTGGLI